MVGVNAACSCNAPGTDVNNVCTFPDCANGAAFAVASCSCDAPAANVSGNCVYSACANGAAFARCTCDAPAANASGRQPEPEPVPHELAEPEPEPEPVERGPGGPLALPEPHERAPVRIWSDALAARGRGPKPDARPPAPARGAEPFPALLSPQIAASIVSSIKLSLDSGRRPASHTTQAAAPSSAHPSSRPPRSASLAPFDRRPRAGRDRRHRLGDLAVPAGNPRFVSSTLLTICAPRPAPPARPAPAPGTPAPCPSDMSSRPRITECSLSGSATARERSLLAAAGAFAAGQGYDIEVRSPGGAFEAFTLVRAFAWASGARARARAPGRVPVAEVAVKHRSTDLSVPDGGRALDLSDVSAALASLQARPPRPPARLPPRPLPPPAQPLPPLPPLAPFPPPPPLPARPVPIDRAVPRVATYIGGESEANRHLEEFIERKLRHYADKRNEPSEDYVSHISPCLHFGQISPLRIALEVSRRATNAEAKKSYIEELVVRPYPSLPFPPLLPSPSGPRVPPPPVRPWARPWPLPSPVVDRPPGLPDRYS
eukprot:tig00020952_g16499.t1